jgi:hypothetical protein
MNIARVQSAKVVDVRTSSVAWGHACRVQRAIAGRGRGVAEDHVVEVSRPAVGLSPPEAELPNCTILTLVF